MSAMGEVALRHEVQRLMHENSTLREQLSRFERENHELREGGRALLRDNKRIGESAGSVLRAAQKVIDAWDACLAYPDTSSERGDIEIAVQELREATNL